MQAPESVQGRGVREGERIKGMRKGKNDKKEGRREG